MAARTLQPSEYDIQREVEALRDIRRRSINPGALTIDPDLPNQPSSSSSSYRSAVSPTSLSFIDAFSPGSSSDHSSPDETSFGDTTDSTDSTSTTFTADDPFHLFWVPASLHPEIAPAEFRAFLKEHARSPPPSDDGSTTSVTRSISSSSGAALARKRSMLSRQYKPRENDENDEVEEDKVLPLKRNRTGYANRGPQLTIRDLQKLEELAEQASQSDDPSRLRNILRRSLSLNLSPSALDKMDHIPEIGDEADTPIIVPPPGQILRRAQRTTKIKKTDGAGPRSRRGGPRRSHTAVPEARTSTDRLSDRSSSDHGESLDPVNPRRRTFSDEGSQRPDSFTEEAQIYDAYARDEEEEPSDPRSAAFTSPPLPVRELSKISPPSPQVQGLPMELPPTDLPPSLFEALGPIIYQPEPEPFTAPEPEVQDIISQEHEPQHATTPSLSESQHLVTSQPAAEHKILSRTPSPPEEPTSPTIDPPTTDSPPRPLAPSTFLPAPPQSQRKEKDKKGLFGKWAGDKLSKKEKGAKEKDRDSKDRANEKERDSGFFGSLFSVGSKKKQDESPPLVPTGTSPRETVQALLGAPKAKGFVSPVSPSLSAGIGPNNYSRYPIHVERAIYRLSHIKLANPRRPLYEQVLISNLMFWYLGVINKAQSAATSPNNQESGAQPASTIHGGTSEPGSVDKAEKEKELKEKDRVERDQREFESRKRESGKRGSLTKTTGTPSGGRRAEIPVRGPQYEMQHMVMEQEYGGYNGQVSAQMGRSLSAPGGGGGGNGQSSRNPQPQPLQSADFVYYSTDPNQQRLPPGAMPPDQVWQQARAAQSKDDGLLSDAGRYNPNTSQQDNYVLVGRGERLPGRSLSANAVSSPLPQMNGRTRKGQSAHAAMTSTGRRSRNSGDQDDINDTAEEDIPLAMWQQQRRR